MLLFASCYATNMVSGWWEPSANIALVIWARKLLADVEATSHMVHWAHAKGHSADDGNGHAHELVHAWGRTMARIACCGTKVAKASATTALFGRASLSMVAESSIELPSQS